MGQFSPDILSEFDVHQQVDLRTYTRIGIGGPADYLVVVRDPEQLVRLYNICLRTGIRFLPLGHGSNVLFPDEGYRGLVAVLAFDHIEALGETGFLVQAGASLAELNRLCICRSLTGFEFSSGIPGTVGGAVYGNAGAYGKNIGECVTGGRVLLPDGTVRDVDHDFFGFDYRHSALKSNGAILLSVRIALEKGDYEAILKRVREIRSIRCKKLPHWSTLTAGSFFKNIPNPGGHNIAAAKYLDEIGSKQARIGDAGVHPKHANVIYNMGHATARDVLALEDLLRERVRERFQIELQREVMYLD